MNRIKFITNLIGILVCLVSNPLLKAAPNTAAGNNLTESAHNYFASDEIIEERIRNLQSNIEMKYTLEVRRKIRSYTLNYRKSSERLLGEVAIYFPLFEEEIRRLELPEELKYLAIIESDLRPTAISQVGATGLWQFMRGTALMYDLEINRAVDERRDPQKSTIAALNYLSDLYKQFGDWTLAIAAYNCGPGNVRKAIRVSNSTNYWEMRHLLPKETQDYVPRFIAANYLLNYYHAHGLNPREADRELVHTISTRVFDELSFADISDQTGVDFHLIKKLNPAYLRNYIPRNSGRHTLTLPKQYMENFMQLLVKENEKLAKTEDMNEDNVVKFHIPGFIEQTTIMPDPMPKLKTESKSLNVLNETKNEPVDVNQRDNEAIIEHKKQSKIRYEYYKLSGNETLYDVADKREDVTIDELFKINQYSIGNLPKPGTIIKMKEIK